MRFDTDSFLIGVDSFASVTMATRPEQFEDLVLDAGQSVQGIEGGLAIKGHGTFIFNIEDDEGTVHKIKIADSMYVPDLKFCLLSPQHWAQKAHESARGTRMETDADGVILIWGHGDHRRTIPHSRDTNTPVFRTAPNTSTYRAFSAHVEAMEANFHRQQHVIQLPGRRRLMDEEDEFLAEENLLLSEDYRKKDFSATEGASHDDETIKAGNVHTDTSEEDEQETETARIGPLTFDPTPQLEDDEQHHHVATDDQAELMRWHHRLGHLSFAKLKKLATFGEIPKRLAKIKPPVCAGCLFGAMTKVPWRGKEGASDHAVFEATAPGQIVSVDQMISTQVGFIAQLKGALTKKRYTAATVFTDHYSRLQYIHLMTRLTSQETVEAKRAFEHFAEQHGVRIMHYHCDNGRFADNDFKTACASSNQRLTFCGVNAHFQNGIAEKAIRDLRESARKQLLHANHRWPAAIHLALWPYALRYATYLHNTLPVLDDGTSRLEMFSSIRVGMKLGHMHTFGCPVFALQNELSSGKTIPHWSPRARLGINLGPSPSHARNVYLILNLHTGCVSPQFHCRFDDFYETVKHGGPDVSVPSIWQQLAGLVTSTQKPSMEFHDELRNQVHSIPRDTAVPSSSSNASAVPEDIDFFYENDNDSIATTPEILQAASNIPLQDSASTPPNVSRDAGTSLRGRARKMSRAMAESVSQREFFGNDKMHYMAARAVTEHDYDRAHDEHLSLQDRMRHPIAFLSEMLGDTMHLHQALRQPDSRKFVDSVIKEINGHVDRKHWEVTPRADVPEDTDVLPSVWAVRRKRNLTTGEITKHKARLNLHGGKQEFGMTYYDTYAPVVTWFAIRLMIVFGIIFSWSLRQVDFVMAYPQAPIEMDMYMELPDGILLKEGDRKDHVLKLLANLYGQKQAGRVWNGYLVEKLLELGFKQSQIDDCVFYRGDVIFIVYVDDGIFLGSSDEQLSGIITEMRNLELDIEDQGHPADYVGVNIKRLKDGSIGLSQRGLIDTIIQDAGLQDSKVKAVPAKVNEHLHAHLDKPPFSLNFNYRSMVGKLNYLAQTTRPDIMYATHQLAKYSSNPREPHGDAALYLVRYLKKSRDIGLRFTPDPEKGFECYCDADFSGNWNKQFARHDPSTSKSRSGWVVFYAGCPIIWASRLQTQVALSTTEAEYIAMSQSLRDVLPIMFLIQEMKEKGFQVICTQPYVYCKVFEDNSGALELARLPKLRPRTKHINVCYHHFREHVRNGLIKIFPVGTKDQTADVLTKALPQNDFQRHRHHMCGQ